MEPLPVGTVALVAFPFSDLSRSKLRPALVLAEAGRGDFILCQITSNPYADPTAVELTDRDFSEGSLRRVSYVRPGKLFTAHQSILRDRVGVLDNPTHARVIEVIVGFLRSKATER